MNQVYVSTKGSRSKDCGSRENPCQRIDDVLFNRKTPVTINLEAFEIPQTNTPLKNGTSNVTEAGEGQSRRRRDVSDKTQSSISSTYTLLFPLNIQTSVTFKKYGVVHTKPVIKTERDHLFIMRSSGHFSLQDVDIDLPENGILLDIDSANHHLESIFLKNTISLKEKVVAINMKIYQGVGNINASDVCLEKGTLLRIQGNSYLNPVYLVTKGDTKQNINGRLMASNVNAKHIVHVEEVESHVCKINKVSIEGGKPDYGMYFKSAICQIKSLEIRKVTIRHSALYIRRGKLKDQQSEKDEEMEKMQEIGRYLFNFPYTEPTPSTHDKTNPFTIDIIDVQDSTMTKVMEISNTPNKVKIYEGLKIYNNSLDQGVEITHAHFFAKNVNIIRNKIPRTMIQHKKGELYLEDVIIKENKHEMEDITKALVYSATPDSKTKFTLKNCNIEWPKEREENHPPLVDIYLGNGFYEIENVTISSYTIHTSTMASIEVESDTKTEEKPFIKNLRIDCSQNRNSTHKIEQSIRGRILHMQCVACEINTYTQQKSSLILEGKELEGQTFDEKLKVHNHTETFKCHPCPVGGTCKNGIKSSGNFFGYTNNYHGTVEFTACPKAYCCTKKECININSCKNNRDGRLCGTCKEGYQESFFSDECILKKDCGDTSWFWLFYIVTALLSCVLFLFIKNITNFFKSMNIKDKMGKLFKICCGRVKKSCSGARNFDEQGEEMVGLNDVESKGRDKNENGAEVTIVPANEKSDEDEEEPAQMTMSGAFNIIVGFYQIRSLLTVDVGEEYRKSSTYQAKITEIMDLNFIVFIKSLCPMEGLTAKGEGFIQNQLVVIFMLLWAILFLIIYFIGSKTIVLCYRKLRGRRVEPKAESPQLTFTERVGLGMIRIICFGYKNVANFAIICFHCVEIDGFDVWFLNGQEKCFQLWQYCQMVFVAIWVIPFPAALMLAYRMFMRHVISLRKFVFCLIFPPAAFIWNFLRSSRVGKDAECRENKQVCAFLKEMFEEAYRKRDGKEYYVFWETWRLYQRLILAFVTTLAINPVNRICYAAPIILIFIFVYWYIKPYKEQFVILHWMEVIGLLGITFTLVNNMFRSFLYVFEIPDQPPIPRSLLVLWYLDLIASPFFVLIFMKLVAPVFIKIKNACGCDKCKEN